MWKRITVFQTQLALGYSVLSHRQLVPRAAVARPSAQRFQITKSRQKLHKETCEIDWSHLCLQPFDKFQIYSACNHRKRKWCKSVEIDLQKFVKSHQVNLFLAGFGHLKPLCSGGLEGESPSSDCRRLVCSSMLLLCRGAFSREKTGKEPTNISCSNYTIQTDSTQA